MFEALCGVDALANVILTTTKWDEVHEIVGMAREKAIREGQWKPMLHRGSRMARFQTTHESAWDIINMLTTSRRPLRLQVEMVDEGKSLMQTAAGSALFEFLERLIEKIRGIFLGLQRWIPGVMSSRSHQRRNSVRSTMSGSLQSRQEDGRNDTRSSNSPPENITDHPYQYAPPVFHSHELNTPIFTV
jgi:hypothetical protein